MNPAVASSPKSRRELEQDTLIADFAMLLEHAQFERDIATLVAIDAVRRNSDLAAEIIELKARVADLLDQWRVMRGFLSEAEYRERQVVEQELRRHGHGRAA